MVVLGVDLTKSVTILGVNPHKTGEGEQNYIQTNEIWMIWNIGLFIIEHSINEFFFLVKQ